MKKYNCEHSVTPEVRNTPPRFLDTQRTMTLEEALDAPLKMDAMPFDVSSMSPTPLDPYNLQVHGIGYRDAALQYMVGSMYAAAGIIQATEPGLIKRVEDEIAFQHRHRMEKNSEALDRLKESASRNPEDKVLNHNAAEGIMQVRAGVSRYGALLELLAKRPELGGVEIAKATRPLCFSASEVARMALHSSLKSLGNRNHINVIESNFEDGAPLHYRTFIEAETGILLTKTKLMEISIGGQALEVISRDSAILINPAEVPSELESVDDLIVGDNIRIPRSTIDTTTYVRVKSEDQ